MMLRTSQWQYQSYAEPITVTAVVLCAGAIGGTIITAPQTIQYQAVAAPARRPVSVVVAGSGSAAPSGIVSESWQYQAGAAPVKTTAAVTLSWAPTFENPLRLVLPQIVHTVSPFSPVFPVPALSWKGVWPDTARGVTPIVAEGRFAWQSNTPLATPLVWQGRFADRVDGPRPLVADGWRAQPSIVTAPVPSLSWRGVWPDAARDKSPLVPEGFYAWQPQTPLPVPMTWQGRYPERADGARPLVPEGGRTQPSIVVAPVPSLSWRSIYPDAAKGPAPLVPEGDYVWNVATPLPTPLTWRSLYPHRADGPAPLVAEGGRTEPVIGVAPVPTVSWRGFTPSIVPGPQPLTDWQTFAWSQVRPSIAMTGSQGGAIVPRVGAHAQYQSIAAPTTRQQPILTALSWQGSYPTLLRQPNRVVIEQEQYKFGVIKVVPVMSWTGWYPDFAPGRYPHQAYTAQPQYHFAVVIIVPTFSCRFYFPDIVDRPKAALASGGLLAPLPIVQPVNQYGWRGRYPDWLPRQRPADFPAVTTGALSPAFPLPRPLVWQGRYPDLVWAARTPTEAFPQASFYPAPILVPTNQLGWRGSYPDWLPLLRPVEYPAWTTGMTASVLPLPKPLVWKPIYDDFARTKYLPVAAMPANGAMWPKPLAELPLGSWQPTYADWIARVTLPVAGHPAFFLGQFRPTFAVPALAWKGVWTDRVVLAAPRLDTANQQAWATGSTSSTFPLPKPLVWRGTWADFARGREPLPVAAMQTTAGIKPLFFAGPEVLRFTLESVNQPVFVVEMVLQPKVDSGVVNQAAMKNESVD